MNCLLRPDLCDEIRQRIKGEDGITPIVPTNSSDGSDNKRISWTPPTSRLFSGSKDGDPTSHVITALLLFLIFAYIAYFLGKKNSVTQNKWNKLKKIGKELVLNQNLICILQCDTCIADLPTEAFDDTSLNFSAVACLNEKTFVFRPKANCQSNSSQFGLNFLKPA